MTENITITVNEDLIRIDTPSGYFHMDAYKIYEELKFIYAREDVKQYLDDCEFSEEDITRLSGNERYVRAWMNAVANNECIAECKRLAAEETAHDFLSHKEVA